MSSKQKLSIAFKHAFPHTIPVLAGFTFLGIAYGILMSTKGYGIVWSFLMSSIAFCGSMQFVAITLLTAAFNPIYAFFLSIMVNARHLFYGISMLDKYKGIGKIKGFLIYILCDETFSIVSSTNCPETVDRKWFYFWISFLDYLYWVLGSVLGGALGNVLHFNTKGLDFVLTALFVVILVEQWETPTNRVPALIGIGSTLICLVVFGKSTFIITAMIAILLLLSAMRSKLEYTSTHEKKEERTCI